MSPSSIAIVDDHQLFRAGLSELINSCSDFTVVFEAENGADFIQKLSATNPPEIVLLDIKMKEMDGFQTAEWLKKFHPQVNVLALSMYEDETTIIRMLKAGARGYLQKDIRKEELLNALYSIRNKGYYYSDLVTGKLIHLINADEPNKKTDRIGEHVTLSGRELEFLKLVCSERTYKEVAGEMNLSVHTVEGYRESLFEKLGVKSRVGLAMYAIKHRLFLID